jgi:hypothetical protein
MATNNFESIAWRCQFCSDGDSLIILSAKVTTPAIRHLKRKHRDTSSGEYEDSSDAVTMTNETS